MGCEARKIPAAGEVFFLDFTFYRTYQDVGTSKNLQVCECLTGLYSANSKLVGAHAILPGGRLGPYEILSAIGADCVTLHRMVAEP